MTQSRTVFGNVVVTMMGRIYTGLLTFVIVALFLPRVLTGEGFGIYSFYSTLFIILGVIVDFGSNTIAVREGARAPERLGSIMHSVTVLRFRMALLCFAIAILLVWVFEETWPERLLVAGAALHLVFHSIGGFGAIFHVEMKFSAVVFANAIGHTAFFGASLLLFTCRWSEPGFYLVAFGAGGALTNVIFFFRGRCLVGGPITSGRDDGRRLFREALPLGISAMVSIAYFHIDTILLRPLQGDEAVGLYNAAYRLVTFAILFPVYFNQVLLPLISRLATTDPGRFRRVVERALLYMGVAGIPIAVSLLFLSEEVLRLIYPEPFARAADCLTILGIAVAIIFMTYPQVSTLIALGRQKSFTYIAVIGLGLNVLLNVVWIPLYSIEGAAWATLITEAFVFCATLYFVKRNGRFWALGRRLFPIVPVAGIMAAASWWLCDEPMAIVLPALGLLYGGALFLFRLLPFDLGDEDRD